MNKQIRLVIVDDHPIVIQGLRSVFMNNAHITIIADFNLGKDLTDFMATNQVDLVLLDGMLRDGNGIDLCRKIKMISTDTYVLAFSHTNERSIITQMLHQGASGYLLKNTSVEELTHCIYKTLNGEVTFSKAVKEVLARPASGDLKRVPELTKREKEVLGLIAEGKTTTLMAKQLFVSPLTIESHRRNLLQKFEAKNVASLIHLASGQGLFGSTV